MNFELIQTQFIPIDLVKENRGQVDGLPANPRSISPSKLRKLCQSIRDYPEMLALREILVYPYKGKYIIVGGNMRYRAMKQMEFEQVPCKIIPGSSTPEQIKAYMLRDNSHFGEWEFSEVNITNFDLAELELAQIPMQSIDYRQIAVDATKHASWHSGKEGGDETAGDADDSTGDNVSVEPLCDLVARPAMYFRDEMAFISTFKRSVDGIPLSQIKTEDYVELFACSAEQVARKVLRFRSGKDWAIVTSPARRHKEGNFAEHVCSLLSQKLQIPFHSGYSVAKNRCRIEPIFTPQYEIAESNLILYDDIITTGSTIRAMLDLLSRKNVVVIVGINNN